MSHSWRHNCRLTVNKDVYENHYEELVGYIIAELRGYQFYKNNMEETTKIESEFTGGARDQENCQAHGYGIKGVYETAMGIQMDPDTEAIAKFYQLMKDISPTDVGTDLNPQTPYDVLDFVYVGAYKEALDAMAVREPEEAICRNWSKNCGWNRRRKRPSCS